MIAFSSNAAPARSSEGRDFSVNIPHFPGEEQRAELTRYLQEIGQLPLLTAEQEQVLARRIQLGLAEQKRRQPDARIVADGKQAQYQLIEANYRLVVSIAQRYWNHGKGLTLLDLIQEGNIGLLRCAPKFDPDQGCKFSTYATWWIRQAVLRAIESAGAIRLPIYISTQLRRIRQARLYLLQTLDREPAASELAVATGLNEGRIQALVSVSASPLSLDQAYHTEGDDETASLGLQLADRNAEPLEECAVQSVQESEVSALLRRLLTLREYQIVTAHYGLAGKAALTLEELGQALNMEQTQIRQMEKRAFAKLRRSRVIRSHYAVILGGDQA